MQSEGRKRLMAFHGKQEVKEFYLARVKAYTASHKLLAD
jgi:hypothetical protein